MKVPLTKILIAYSTLAFIVAVIWLTLFQPGYRVFIKDRALIADALALIDTTQIRVNQLQERAAQLKQSLRHAHVHGLIGRPNSESQAQAEMSRAIKTLVGRLGGQVISLNPIEVNSTSQWQKSKIRVSAWLPVYKFVDFIAQINDIAPVMHVSYLHLNKPRVSSKAESNTKVELAIEVSSFSLSQLQWDELGFQVGDKAQTLIRTSQKLAISEWVNVLMAPNLRGSLEQPGPENYTLVAISQRENKSIAVLRDNHVQVASRKVTIGDDLGGWEVMEITRNSVSFVQDQPNQRGQKETLVLSLP